MNPEIKNRFTGEIIVPAGKYESLKDAVEQNKASLDGANLYCANLEGAFLNRASLNRANLYCANLEGAFLNRASLNRANLYCANLDNTKGLIKIIGVEIGNFYWKRFDAGLINNQFQFRIGINKLLECEKFASDERILCSFPGFHFASRSWCAVNYPKRMLEAKIRIPEGAQINEPWATDGKASADMIEILQVFDVTTGEDVTNKYFKEVK